MVWASTGRRPEPECPVSRHARHGRIPRPAAGVNAWLADDDFSNSGWSSPSSSCCRAEYRPSPAAGRFPGVGRWRSASTATGGQAPAPASGRGSAGRRQGFLIEAPGDNRDTTLFDGEPGGEGRGRSISTGSTETDNIATTEHAGVERMPLLSGAHSVSDKPLCQRSPRPYLPGTWYLARLLGRVHPRRHVARLASGSTDHNGRSVGASHDSPSIARTSFVERIDPTDPQPIHYAG